MTSPVTMSDDSESLLHRPALRPVGLFARPPCTNQNHRAILRTRRATTPYVQPAFYDHGLSDMFGNFFDKDIHIFFKLPKILSNWAKICK